jgi:hypothetical protein
LFTEEREKEPAPRMQRGSARQYGVAAETQQQVRGECDGVLCKQHTVVASPLTPTRSEYLFSNVKIFRKIQLFLQNTSKIDTNKLKNPTIISDSFLTSYRYFFLVRMEVPVP